MLILKIVSPENLKDMELKVISPIAEEPTVDLLDKNLVASCVSKIDTVRPVDLYFSSYGIPNMFQSADDYDVRVKCYNNSGDEVALVSLKKYINRITVVAPERFCTLYWSVFVVKKEGA